VRPISVTARGSAADTCANSLLEDNVREAAGQPLQPAGVAAVKRTRTQLNQPDVRIASGGAPQVAYLPERGIG